MPPLWHAQPFRSDESAAGKYRFGISLTCALIAPLVRGRSRSERGIGRTSRGPKFALQTLGFMGGAHEWRWPRRLTSAPASVDTVAAFRPWRSFRPSVARGRQGHHGDLLACDVGVGAKLAERGFGFKKPLLNASQPLQAVAAGVARGRNLTHFPPTMLHHDGAPGADIARRRWPKARMTTTSGSRAWSRNSGARRLRASSLHHSRRLRMAW